MLVRGSFAFALCLAVSAITGCAADSSGDVGSQSDEIRSSDLTRDLAKPGGWVGTPFRDQDERALGASLAQDLNALVQRCVQLRETPTSILPTRNLCPSEIHDIVRDERKVTEKAVVELGGRELTAVIWDNEQSDGGDVQDLAIYDASGRRLGVYRAISGQNDTVIDALLAAFGEGSSPVVISNDEYADELLRDVSNDVVSICQQVGHADCSYAASLYGTNEAQWSAVTGASGGPKPTTEASAKDAMKRCLFSNFDLSGSQEEQAASRVWQQLRERNGTLGVYESSRNASRPELESVRTALLSSTAASAPSCSIVFRMQHSTHFLEMAVGVQN